MAILLFCVGAGALVGGLAMAGFGIPVSEFSFGNTLIIAGTTTAVGGLISIGFGAVVSQLQQVMAAIAVQTPARSTELSRNDAIADQNTIRNTIHPEAPAGQYSFPRPRRFTGKASLPGGAGTVPEAGAASVLREQTSPSFAPSLANPDETPVAPMQDMPPPLSHNTRLDSRLDSRGRGQDVQEEQISTAQRRAFGGSKPDMPRARSANVPQGDFVKETVAAPALAARGTAERAEVATAEVAILKSGIVDGMGYTLYVDGSIEAEMPQGTLRFASIDELRGYLRDNA